jgi:transposase InsO family protein
MSRSLQNRSGLNTRQLCKRLGMSSATLGRWRQRSRAGEVLLQRPGPKKLGSLPFGQLRADLEMLRHRRKRSAGSTALYRQYRDAISRRDLANLVTHERQTLNGQRRRNFKRIIWKEANVAWAIDATQYGVDLQGRKLVLIPALDLASRFSFQPLVTLEPVAEDVAIYLAALFARNGAPLFLKRDNGSIFNNHAVDQVLASHGVIPLNSPAYYPPYNGAVEKSIRDLKQTLSACLPHTPATWQPDAIAPFVRAAAHLRNARPRRSLGGLSPAQTYPQQGRSRFGKRQRHTTFEWIRGRSNEILESMETLDRRNVRAAWRLAAETWLRCQDLISVSVNHKVLPHLSLKPLS